MTKIENTNNMNYYFPYHHGKTLLSFCETVGHHAFYCFAKEVLFHDSDIFSISISIIVSYLHLKMSTKGNKCMFFNCGKSKRTHNNIKLFRFPKNQNQAKEWIKQSGKLI